MSKDRDGIEDDDRLAPDGSSADDSAGSAGLTAGPTDAEILSDPETEAPDALDIEAEIEPAESAEGLEPGSSEDGVRSNSEADDSDDEDADDEDADAELAVVSAGSSRAGRRSPARSGVTDKKDAPTKPRDVDQREGLFARLSRFLREVVAELRKVIWPSRRQMITYTVVVIVFLVIMVALVYGMDVLFHLVVGKVLG